MTQLATSAPKKPTVIIIPGSYSPSLFYATIVSDLLLRGYNAICLDYPSIGPREKVQGVTMQDDADHISAVATEHADKGEDIIFAMHSYGGICGTQASKSLSKSERHEKGLSGGIINLVYITAVVPSLHHGNLDVLGPYLDPRMVSEDFLPMKPEDATWVFSDLPENIGRSLVAAMPGHSLQTFRDPLTHAGYDMIPVTYLICNNDKVIPPHVQREMLAEMKKTNTQGIKVLECSAGHVPNITQPSRFIEAVLHAAGDL